MAGWEDACIVLGNGPSLRGFDFHSLDGFATLGMNAAYRHWDRIGWYPTYYACLDDQLIKTHHAEIERLYADRLVKKVFVHGDFFKHHPHRLLNPDFTSFDQTSAHWYRQSAEALGLVPLHERPAFRISNSSKITTGAQAVRYVANEGFKKIVLLGIDLRYVEILPEAEATEGVGLVMRSTPRTNPNYFFDGYQQAGDRYNIPNPTVHQGNLHEQAFELIPKDFETNGVSCRIWNANRASVISDRDIFPYVSIENVTGQSRLGCVFVPTNAREIEAILDNFRLWAEPALSPSADGPLVHKPALVFVFNNTSAMNQQNRIASAFREYGMGRYFRDIRFEYLDLEGEHDAYIRDYTQPVGDRGYKAGPNGQFFASLRKVAGHGRYAFLMETDCLPVRRGWLSQIQKLVNTAEPFWIMGSSYRGQQMLSKDSVRHINGNSVYAVGDPDFQAFVLDFWEHHTWRLIREKDKRLAYDCILEIMFSEQSLRDGNTMDVWKRAAHNLRYCDFIQNISGNQDIAETNESLVPRIRREFPDTYILHNRAAHKISVEELRKSNPPNRHVDPADLGHPRLLVLDMTAMGNGSATGEIKSNLLANWPAEGILQIARHGAEGLTTVRRGDGTWAQGVLFPRRRLWRPVTAFAPQVLLYRPVPDAPVLHDLAMNVIRSLNLPLVTWIMDDWPARMAEDVPDQWARMEPDLGYLLERSTRRLSISEAMSEAFARRYGHPFVPLANGIDPAEWPLAPRGKQEGPFVLRFAGGLAADMGRASVLRVAEAVERLASKGHSILFEVSTQKWWHSQCHKSFAAFSHTRLEIAERSPQEYRRWLQQADMLLIAYNFDAASLRYIQYSQGNKMPECLASGAPILAHGPQQATTIAYLAAHDAARVVDEESIDRLEQVLLVQIADRNGRDAMATRARALATERHNIHDHRDQFRRLIVSSLSVPFSDVAALPPLVPAPRAKDSGEWVVDTARRFLLRCSSALLMQPAGGPLRNWCRTAPPQRRWRKRSPHCLRTIRPPSIFTG